jgi:hypothetical protein
MRADICDSSDTATLLRLKRTLQELDADVIGDFDSPLGVRLYEVRVGADVLHVFADDWSIDIDGPPALVERIVAAVKE